MTYLHLTPNEKFTESYIDFINKSFDSQEHLFLIIGTGIKAKITQRENVKQVSASFKNLLPIIKEINKAKKVFLHSLFIDKIIGILFFQPWLLKKCYWLVWGADLYQYQSRSEGFKEDIFESLRGFVIKNMGGLITHIKGDYELAKRWYGAKGTYYYSFLYPSNLYKHIQLDDSQKEKGTFYIQVGNSADSSNNHLEVFEKLKKFKDMPIEIICPLSYGNNNYRQTVIEKGRDLFGDKFKPLLEFIPLDEYLEILAKIDVAIFNHKRQQGIGNITTLLGLGKKVYIRNDITTWSFCQDHSLVVYSLNDDLDDLLIKMDKNTVLSNINITKFAFSEQKLIESWRSIFYSIK